MFKRILITILSLMLLLSCTSCTGQYSFEIAACSIRQYSSHSFVYRYHDHSVSKMSSDESETIYPASITKLLTALTALDILAPDVIISPGDEVYLPSEGASSAYIRPHHELALEMLIEGMLLPSGNDAAYAIAAACGKAVLQDEQSPAVVAIEAFVRCMNEYAEAIGCTGSNFTTPDGFAGEEHYSTLDDMILICCAAAENDMIAKYAAMQYDHVVYASGHTNTWTNTNKMLDPASEFYNEHVIGLKTGSLENNYSLVTLYDDGEYRYLIGVFGAEYEKGRYVDTQNLLEAEIAAQEASK